MGIRCQGGDRSGKFEREAHEEKGKDSGEKKTRSCHYCKKLRHLKRNCFTWKKKQAQREQEGTLVDVAEYFEEEVLNIVAKPVKHQWFQDIANKVKMLQ